VPPQSAAGTLRLSAATDHQYNLYDDLRPSYECLSTSAATACCDDEYLTPAHVTSSDTWTTATMDGYVRATDRGACHAGLVDSGKYLQLQDSVYYEYI